MPGSLTVREQVAYQPTRRAARFVPRINRAKAEKLLADFLQCVEEVNAHPDLPHWVTEVRVFGSYLNNSDNLGEIDLAIKKERRPASGSISDAYPERLVALLLKGGSRYISLHGVAELDENFEFGGKTIYTFAPGMIASGDRHTNSLGEGPANPQGLQTLSFGSKSQMIGAKEQGPKRACGCVQAYMRFGHS